MNASADHSNEFLRKFRNHLPQWRLNGSAYFITWDLLKKHGEFSPAERSFVVSTLLHFNRDRYYIYAYVVMDDHVHVLVKPLGEYDMSKVLQGWKSYTANQLQRRFKRQGSIWQKDSYTHIIRDEEDFITKAEYILTNPQRRWPEVQGYEWLAWMGFAED
jgi:REP element-mobilizing transposase RayT